MRFEFVSRFVRYNPPSQSTLLTGVDPSMHRPIILGFSISVCCCRVVVRYGADRWSSFAIVRVVRRMRGIAARSFVVRAYAASAAVRALLPRPRMLARNLRPRATSNHLLIEYSSNSGNISRHFALHAPVLVI